MGSNQLTRYLCDWFREEARDLPWRNTDDPYAIWVSEVMLQQTRVETVMDYYDDFMVQFPTVQDLADASQDEVLKVWEGMGFYARARRLHESARIVVNKHDGSLPREYEELIELPGVGDYTAAAIEAFAFDGCRPIMDGNVKRVVSRIQNISNPIDRTDTEQRIRDFLDECLDQADTPGLFSESLMELGAIVCTATGPSCDICPVRQFCEAYEKGTQGKLPVTSDSAEKPHYEIAAGVIQDGEEILIARRPEDKMLGGLWEFPGGKQEDGEELDETLRRELREELDIEVIVHDKITTVPHEYSHLSINLHAFWCKLENGTPTPEEGQKLKWITSDELDNYAFPKANKSIVNDIQQDQLITGPRG